MTTDPGIVATALSDRAEELRRAVSASDWPKAAALSGEVQRHLAHLERIAQAHLQPEASTQPVEYDYVVTAANRYHGGRKVGVVFHAIIRRDGKPLGVTTNRDTKKEAEADGRARTARLNGTQ